MNKASLYQPAAYCLALLGLQSGCSFLLDFDSLRGGEKTAPITADAAAPGCSCASDNDPCTDDFCRAEQCVHEPKQCNAIDSCHDAKCVEGQCVQLVQPGFVDDGYSRDIAADPKDFIYRTTTAAGNGKFFVATYGRFNGERDVELRMLNTKDTDEKLVRLSANLDQSRALWSPAALVVVGETLFAYVVTLPRSADTSVAGQVTRLQFSATDLSSTGQAIPVSASPNFRFGNDTLGPTAGLSKQGPFVAWPGCSTQGSGDKVICAAIEPATESHAGIYLQTGNTVLGAASSSLPGREYIPETESVIELAALSGGDTPGAAWLVGKSSELRMGYLETSPKVKSRGPLCASESSFVARALNTACLSSGAVRAISLSGSSASKPATEFFQLGCDDSSCDLDLPASNAHCLASDPTSSTASNAAIGVYEPSTDTPAYLAAIYLLTDSKQRAVALKLSRIVADAKSDSELWNAPSRLLSSANDDQLDWPSLAVAADGRALMTWRSRDANTHDVLHVLRQRICLPED